jgi:hypothetical protein
VALRFVLSAGFRVANASDCAWRLLLKPTAKLPPPHLTFCVRPVLPVIVSVTSMSAPAVCVRGKVDWLRTPRFEANVGR